MVGYFFIEEMHGNLIVEKLILEVSFVLNVQKVSEISIFYASSIKLKSLFV